MPDYSLLLRPLHADVQAVHTRAGAHVGNLKRVGSVWKFKAIGYDSDGSVVPGGGPLTLQHNATFDSTDEAAVNERLAAFLPP